MYLKKIEVNGFKSFANKLVFEFNDGITGIVGPNGSGKSNIGDAVRWVLGEQSAKQLRGNKMEDVIFSGTESRKPVSFASVSLVLDNSDHSLDIEYDEVTVTRRVYRSGESEYIINDTPCRLKDIHELFYDTGVGKEGYSIIGQGQIEKILSTKPEDRRELFDEAAGIVKYKKRKSTALKNLEDESNNLVRISDILAELEKQVGPLKHQSEKAKEYLKFKEELKNFEVNLFLIEADSIKTELSDVTKKLDIVTADLEESSRKFDEIKTIYDEKEAELRKTNSEIEELTSNINNSEIEKNNLSGKIELLKEQINSAKKSDAHFEERIESFKAQIKDKEEEKNEILSSQNDTDMQLDSVYGLKNACDAKLSELNKELLDTENRIEECNKKYYENIAEKGNIGQDVSKFKTLLEQNNIKKAELTGRLLNFKTDESALNEKVETLTKKNNELQNKADECRKKSDNLNALCDAERAEKNELSEKLNTLKEMRIKNFSRRESLENIAERYEGYGNSIREVMKQKSEESGILGVVADIIKTDKQYETAIETALGGTIQNIVTKDEETAKRMIRFLKEGRLGRATFLPLMAITVKDFRKEDLSHEKGFIGYASSLVKAGSEYSKLCEYLLGRCIVVDNIDNAINLSRKNGHSQKIVTLEGELLNPGGSMTGGSFKNSSNLLGRRREIEELNKLIKNADSQISEIEEKLSSLVSSIAEKRNSINAENELLQDILLKKTSVYMELKEEIKRQEEFLSKYEYDKSEDTALENDNINIKKEMSDKNELLHHIDSENESLLAKIKTLKDKQEKLKEELSKKQTEADEIKNSLMQITQKKEFSEENVKRILREINRLKDDISDIEDNKLDSTAEISAKNSEIEAVRKDIDSTQKAIDEMSKMLSDRKALRDKSSETIKSFFSQREECAGRMTALDKEQFRLTQSKERLTSSWDAKVEYMWEEYELTTSSAAKLKDEELTDEKFIKKRTNELRGDIKKLGDVNVGAIEEYKEVSERYEFLKGQYDDLIESKERLVAEIEKLDTGMREKFSESFEQIKQEFDRVYKQLFGGGKGTIELEEGVDILEADITIISQPPGKKLRNMMQLSGGEKALTAICVLFTIQNLKPSPFCLLDEIEAALDDNNVVRFAKYLHKLTNHTQFIVITHRRGTMSCADRLYGITMQEKGVSTLVSVDLIESQLEDKKD